MASTHIKYNFERQYNHKSVYQFLGTNATPTVEIETVGIEFTIA